jgi:hypothetical protein
MPTLQLVGSMQIIYIFAHLARKNGEVVRFRALPEIEPPSSITCTSEASAKRLIVRIIIKDIS